VRRALLLLALALARPAHADPPWSAASRARQIERALAALAESDPAALARTDGEARRMLAGPCASGFALLQLQCLTASLRKRCAEPGGESPRCIATFDVVASNLLGEERLLPESERDAVLDPRTRARAIERARSALALDFRLRMGPAASDRELAAQIDRYCLRSADDTGLPWQTCASSLIWTIRAPRASGAAP
jgi:hypothetical protein